MVFVFGRGLIGAHWGLAPWPIQDTGALKLRGPHQPFLLRSAELLALPETQKYHVSGTQEAALDGVAVGEPELDACCPDRAAYPIWWNRNERCFCALGFDDLPKFSEIWFASQAFVLTDEAAPALVPRYIAFHGHHQQIFGISPDTNAHDLWHWYGQDGFAHAPRPYEVLRFDLTPARAALFDEVISGSEGASSAVWIRDQPERGSVVLSGA